MFISILGRQPGISLAELEVIFGSERLTKLSSSAVLVDSEPVGLDKLGGSIKIISDVHELESYSWESASNDAQKRIGVHARNHSQRKMTIGLSVYTDEKISSKQIQRFLIQEKKQLRSHGYSVRVIPNDSPVLNSAKVFHNKLTQEHNAEIVLVRSEQKKYWIGRTESVQNIEALAFRDQGRPKRDSKVGMLPPKLAQIMINLAGDGSGVLLDPFCGTGVVLQEALLMGLDVYGTDIEERMIDYTYKNLEWLKNEFALLGNVKLTQDDATVAKWIPPISLVVSEVYLGPPLSAEPSPDKLAIIRSEANSLIKSFLLNIAKQIEKDTPLCLAVPAWRVGGKIIRLNFLDDLEKLGYTRRVLKHASNRELTYFRPDQYVARELLVLKRNQNV